MTSSITPSAAGLRALSHPTRLAILKRLRLSGPATATMLASELSLNSGATSYHLRQLADHGFVEDDAERGDARDRWWRAAHQSTRTELTYDDEESAEVSEAYHHSVALAYTETLMQAVGEQRYLPRKWQQAGTTSDWHLRLTAARAQELVELLARTIEGWDEEDDDPDAAQFVVNLNAFPLPGTVVTEEESR